MWTWQIKYKAALTYGFAVHYMHDLTFKVVAVVEVVVVVKANCWALAEVCVL